MPSLCPACGLTISRGGGSSRATSSLASLPRGSGLSVVGSRSITANWWVPFQRITYIARFKPEERTSSTASARPTVNSRSSAAAPRVPSGKSFFGTLRRSEHSGTSPGASRPKLQCAAGWRSVTPLPMGPLWGNFFEHSAGSERSDAGISDRSLSRVSDRRKPQEQQVERKAGVDVRVQVSERLLDPGRGGAGGPTVDLLGGPRERRAFSRLQVHHAIDQPKLDQDDVPPPAHPHAQRFAYRLGLRRPAFGQGPRAQQPLEPRAAQRFHELSRVRLLLLEQRGLPRSQHGPPLPTTGH